MTIEEVMELLSAAGFSNGWSLLGTSLTLWEHEQDPPAPLTRPTNETITANTAGD